MRFSTGDSASSAGTDVVVSVKVRRSLSRPSLAVTMCAALTVGCASKATTTTTSTCADPTLKLVFSPMYSAVIPGDDTHSFQLPVVVEGVSGSALTWRASDLSAVSITPDSLTGGVLLTMLGTAKSPGTPVTITANTSTACGTATLDITSATTDDWTTGEARYNDRVSVEAGTRAACSDCHAPHADAGRGFNDIAHTPEQTGGFSDQQLVNIVQNGVVPDGGYFDKTIVSYSQWQAFHQWNLTSSEQVGIVVYLRSLVPTAQMGTANFGGVDAASKSGH